MTSRVTSLVLPPRPDCCDSLLAGALLQLTDKLQKVQSCSASLMQSCVLITHTVYCSRDMTSAVDWALRANYLSVCFSQVVIAFVRPLVLNGFVAFPWKCRVKVVAPIMTADSSGEETFHTLRQEVSCQGGCTHNDSRL